MKSESNQIRIVLSGGLCNGKTTTLRALKKLCSENKVDAGFVSEAANDLIREAKESGSDCLPWKNPRWFQIRLFFLQDARENTPKNHLVFMDRCKIDGLAYYWLDNLTPHPIVEMSVNREKYDLVFFLENLPYRNSAVRVESEDIRTKITNLINEAYFSLGYLPIFVPVMSARKRAEFIFEKVMEFLEKK